MLNFQIIQNKIFKKVVRSCNQAKKNYITEKKQKNKFSTSLLLMNKIFNRHRNLNGSNSNESLTFSLKKKISAYTVINTLRSKTPSTLRKKTQIQLYTFHISILVIFSMFLFYKSYNQNIISKALERTYFLTLYFVKKKFSKSFTSILLLSGLFFK